MKTQHQMIIERILGAARVKDGRIGRYPTAARKIGRAQIQRIVREILFPPKLIMAKTGINRHTGRTIWRYEDLQNFRKACPYVHAKTGLRGADLMRRVKDCYVFSGGVRRQGSHLDPQQIVIARHVNYALGRQDAYTSAIEI